ncbi:MAG: hypothetical protein B6244_02550 [Candidatus Cloacimonetes bacterium 4572_55]|nr:MAG: hypothetical protein B6244_02550 [Candidatus Cloacimonetes bacterium 4572_55]
MIKINLMPPEEKKESGSKVAIQLPKNFTNVLLAIPIVVTLALVGFLHTEAINKIENLTETQHRLDKENKELQKQIEVVEELKSKQDQLKTRLEMITKLNTNRDFWEKVLVEVSEHLPEEFISIRSFSDASTPEAKRIRLGGSALTDQYISKYISKLRESPYVVDVTLGGTKATQYMGRDARTFNLTVDLKIPEDPTTKTNDPK